MSLRLVAVVLAALAFCVPSAAGDDWTVVAVFELEAKDLKLRRSAVERLTDYISSLLASDEHFHVVPRRK
ncbi:MAG: hypothetical protein GYA21_02730 [Myxococcales bacterium]|nr:hypothetical protein [Myxococcales bacterium]